MNDLHATPNGAAAKVPVEVRYVGAVSGCYSLASGADADGRHARVFACRTMAISTQSALLIAPVAGIEGDWVSVRFDHLGLFKGQVDRKVPAGFVMTIAATPDERARLAARLTWLKRRSMRSALEHRAAQRRIPHDPRSVLLLPDNTTLGCFIIDASRSGVAVSADIIPAIGAPIAVGTLVGTVARRFPSGFAVQFRALQDAKGLEDRLGIHPRARNGVLVDLQALAATIDGKTGATWPGADREAFGWGR